MALGPSTKVVPHHVEIIETIDEKVLFTMPCIELWI
jgi:hypothetical protein